MYQIIKLYPINMYSYKSGKKIFKVLWLKQKWSTHGQYLLAFCQPQIPYQKIREKHFKHIFTFQKNQNPNKNFESFHRKEITAKQKQKTNNKPTINQRDQTYLTVQDSRFHIFLKHIWDTYQDRPYCEPGKHVSIHLKGSELHKICFWPLWH